MEKNGRERGIIPAAPHDMPLSARLAWRAGYRQALEDQPYQKALVGMAESLSQVIETLESHARALGLTIRWTKEHQEKFKVYLEDPEGYREEKVE